MGLLYQSMNQSFVLFRLPMDIQTHIWLCAAVGALDEFPDGQFAAEAEVLLRELVHVVLSQVLKQTLISNFLFILHNNL